MISLALWNAFVISYAILLTSKYDRCQASVGQYFLRSLPSPPVWQKKLSGQNISRNINLGLLDVFEGRNRLFDFFKGKNRLLSGYLNFQNFCSYTIDFQKYLLDFFRKYLLDFFRMLLEFLSVHCAKTIYANNKF